MPTLLDRKLLRDLRRLKGQAVAVSLVMACGLAMLIMARSLIHSLDGTLQDYYRSYRFAEIFVALQRAPNHLAERLGAIPGVAGVQTDIAVPVTLDLPERDEPASGLVRSLPDFGAPELNRLHLRRGRWLTPGSRGEVLVGEAFAAANGLEPGQPLTLLLHGRRQTFRVAGIVLSPEYIFESRPGSALPDSRSYGIFWMPYKEAATAFDLYGAFNHASLALAPGASPEAVKEAVDALLRPYGGLGAYGRKEHPSHVRISDEIRVLEMLAFGFPLIFLSVAAFMTNAVLSRLLALQRDQIAVLKAFGFTNGQITAHYLKFASVIALGGVAAGLAWGVILGVQVVGMYALIFHFPALAFRLDWSAVAVALGVGVAAVVTGVLGAVRQAANLPPAEAMRPEPPADFRAALLERLGLGHLCTHPFRMALRNIERRPVQSFFTVAGLALGTALLIVPNTIKAGIDEVLDFTWDVVQRQDVTLSLTLPTSTAAIHELEHLPGVLTVEPGRIVAARIRFGSRSRQIGIRSLVLGSRHDRVVDARLREVPAPTDGLALSAKLAEVLGARVGDTLVVEALEGRRPTRRVRLVALADDFTGIAAFMELQALNRLLGEGDVVGSVSLTIDAAHRTEFLRSLKGLPRVDTVAVKESMRRSFRETTAQSMGLIQSIYLTFAVIVAFGVIYNNARVSLTERVREMATLRVLGFTRREVGAVIVLELLTLALLALPLGLLLGTGFATAIVQSINTETVRVPLVLTGATYAFAVAVVTAASAFSAFVVLRQLKHLELVGALRAPE